MDNYIGERIKKRRMQLGLTLRDFATISEVSASFISSIETGKSLPSIKIVIKLSKALKVPVSWIIDEEQQQITGKDIINLNINNPDILNKVIFPNNMTYKEICDEIGLLENFKTLLKQIMDK